MTGINNGKYSNIGAEITDGEINFRVWAGSHNKVKLIIEEPFSKTIEMQKEEDGYFSARIKSTSEKMLYRFLPEGSDKALADPVSRYQPYGPEGASQVIYPLSFDWSEGGWKGIKNKNEMIYEMHIGTYTRQGTWQSAAEKLEEIADAGITIIEIMPVCEFIGKFGWGYDGIFLFAPFHEYGNPDDMKAFINKAHRLNLGVILDVVYNHLGPASNLSEFSENYISTYEGEWGKCFNFDSPQVRTFIKANILYWIEEFHIDGFRLDATQEIHDTSSVHIIKDFVDHTNNKIRDKPIFFAAENDRQDRKLIDQYGVNAMWNDDFHHCLRVMLTGRNEAYYSDYKGTSQEITSIVKKGFLYQGQISKLQNTRRGTPTYGIERSKFICYLENHDHVANSVLGKRLSERVSPSKLRCATTLLLTGPWTPLIFQGQEFNSTSPFLFFADVPFPIAKYRQEFLSQFPSIKNEKTAEFLSDPAKKETFLKCKLKENERQNSFKNFFKDLIKLRKNDPILSDADSYQIETAILNEDIFILRFSSSSQCRLLLFNFGKSLFYSPPAEPLLARFNENEWTIIFSSEEPKYGGEGIGQIEENEGWHIPAECAIILKS